METFDLLVSSFGKFEKFEVLRSLKGKETVLPAWVKDCNPRLLPSVIPLHDFTLAFPIKVSIENDKEDEQSLDRMWGVGC